MSTRDIIHNTLITAIITTGVVITLALLFNTLEVHGERKNTEKLACIKEARDNITLLACKSTPPV